MKKLLITVLVLTCFRGLSQDPIYTQFFMVPETLSSSFTGAKQSTRAGILHRTQWPGLNFNINTQFAFVDKWFEDFKSGIGMSILNHSESTTGYNFTQVNLNYTYQFPITDEWNVRPSISVGYGAKDFGFQNLLLEDQINIFTGTINPNSIDSIRFDESVRFFDFSASVLFNSENSWIGLTVKHLNKPNISLELQGQESLEMFFSLHSSIFISFGRYRNYRDLNKLYLLSNFMQQGPYSRFDIGPKYQINRFSFGLLAVTNPIKSDKASHLLTSINAFFGMDWEAFRFGSSYDFNTTNIGISGGVYELSITYDFIDRDNCFGCPDY